MSKIELSAPGVTTSVSWKLFLHGSYHYFLPIRKIYLLLWFPADKRKNNVLTDDFNSANGRWYFNFSSLSVHSVILLILVVELGWNTVRKDDTVGGGGGISTEFLEPVGNGLYYLHSFYLYIFIKLSTEEEEERQERGWGDFGRNQRSEGFFFVSGCFGFESGRLCGRTFLSLLFRVHSPSPSLCLH